MMLLNKSWATSDVRQDANQGWPPRYSRRKANKPTLEKNLRAQAVQHEQRKLHYRIIFNSLTQSVLQVQTQTSAQLCAHHNHNHVQALLAQGQGPRNASSLHHSFLFIPAISTADGSTQSQAKTTHR